MAGLYIHIPFCRSKCAYCDFYSGPFQNRADAFVEALGKEWFLRRSELAGKPIRTIYIGGGTPSLLTESQLARIADWLPVGRQLTEFTIEANPDDVTSDKVAAWRRMGINRVSMGVQSLNDSELAAIGRRHNAEAAISAYETLRAGGVDNISLDLIFGLPGQTLSSWQSSLDAVLSLHPEHLSAYMLSYEPGTRLWAARHAGKIKETPVEVLEQMYNYLCHAARRAGYNHYEISNFAQPHRRSRHNSAYWAGTPYLGLGPGAHSCTAPGLRSYNPSNLSSYLSALGDGHTCHVSEPETITEQLNDRIFTALRTTRGLRLTDLPPEESADVLRQAVVALRVGNLRRVGDRLVIPEERFLVSDAVIRDLLL